MFEPTVNLWLQQFSNPVLDSFFLAVTALGNELFYTLLLPGLYWLADRRKVRQVAFVFMASMILNGVVKEWLALPRPGPHEGVLPIATETSPGFPSGHAQGSATLWTSLALVYPSTFLVGAAIGLITLISLSRLYLGVHYLGDVVGGLALGLGMVALFFLGYRRGWGGRWPLGRKIGLLLVLAPILVFLNPESGAVRAVGFLVGFLIGDWIALPSLPYRPEADVGRQAVKLALGYGGFFGLVYLVERYVPAGLPCLLGYGLAALWVTVGAPALFLALGLVPRAWEPGATGNGSGLAPLGAGAVVTAVLLAALAWLLPVRDPGRLPALGGLDPERVQVVAHRGGALEAPENTLVAVGHASVVGADMVEIDVRLTADGEIVLLHDATVDRTTGGTGRVAELPLDRVAALDAGFHFSPDGTSHPFRGVGLRIPTLGEVLRFFPEKSLLIELKDDDPRLADGVARLLEAHDAAGRVVVASFHQGVMDRFRQRMPQVPTGMTEREALIFVLLQRLGLAFLHPDPPAAALQVPERSGVLPVAGRDLIRRAAERGLPVYVWTVNDEASLRRWAALGSAGIITDRPSALVRILREVQGRT